MEAILPWNLPTDNKINQSMATIIVLEFGFFLDPKGRPLGQGDLWEHVLSSVSQLPGWRSTSWGPRSDNKHGVIIVVVWEFLSPPDGFAFLRESSLSQASPLRPLAPLLTSFPHLLNVCLFPEPKLHFGFLGESTFELELLYLPRDTEALSQRHFQCLFRSLSLFVDSRLYLIHPTPCDFKMGHRGWLLDEHNPSPALVHVIFLQWPSLESERRFKNPGILHEGLLPYRDSPESIYQRAFLDSLTGLADYGVTRETLHFRLSVWMPHEERTTPKEVRCCAIQ